MDRSHSAGREDSRGSSLRTATRTAPMAPHPASSWQSGVASGSPWHVWLLLSGVTHHGTLSNTFLLSPHHGESSHRPRALQRDHRSDHEPSALLAGQVAPSCPSWTEAHWTVRPAEEARVPALRRAASHLTPRGQRWRGLRSGGPSASSAFRGGVSPGPAPAGNRGPRAAGPPFPGSLTRSPPTTWDYPTWWTREGLWDKLGLPSSPGAGWPSAAWAPARLRG